MAATLLPPREGQLPPFDGAAAWLNSAPLTPAALRGRPVLVQFWTFTCINWLRTLAYVRAWHERYRGDGLVVVGVHTPEFAVERSVDNVRRAAEQMQIGYPIAVDSDYLIWRAFGNQYWPALYFADAEGQIRHHHFGEGEYEHSESVIQQLLAAAGADDGARDRVTVHGRGVEAPADWNDLESPETYLGYGRSASFASPGGTVPDSPSEYALPEELGLNQWALAGDWTVGREAAVCNGAGARIAYRFHARDLHLVMSPASGPVRFRALLDGRPLASDRGVDADERGAGIVDEPRLYQLVRQRDGVVGHTFEIEFLDSGVQAYVFTFG